MIELKQYEIDNAEKFNGLKYELEGKTVKEAKSFELKSETIKQVSKTKNDLILLMKPLYTLKLLKQSLKKNLKVVTKECMIYLTLF